ncbi:MAG: hypothetical protein L6435_00675 [Anaerolineae bacterium]|nr:hypothetical protein [Anaerolineae bacterium]
MEKWVQQASGIVFHQRLIEKDPLAPAEFAEVYLDPLVRSLSAKVGSGNDDPIVIDAAVDAILRFVQQPAKYNPDKASLMTYLTMAARGDYLNALEKERRMSSYEVLSDNVELLLDRRNNWMEDAEAEGLERYGVGTREDVDMLITAVSDTISDPIDKELMLLMLNGERKTIRFGQVLGIDQLPLREQEQIVKRNKDRLKKRLLRLGEKFREQRRNQ